LKDTALRETYEEIGVPPENVRIIGYLDDLPTLTGWTIRVFVGILDIPQDFKFAINQEEVSALVKIPIEYIASENLFYRIPFPKDQNFSMLCFDYKDQEWFLNAVFLIETDYTPFQLLSILKNIEQKAGQKYKPIRFGPRILDLDIVLFDDLVINTDDLIIPHPRMHKRRFVLVPLCDIEPDILHPLYHKGIKTILDQLDENGQKVYRLA